MHPSLRQYVTLGALQTTSLSARRGQFRHLAFYLLALTLLTSWLRRYIPYRLWRALHYLAFLTLRTG
jgi:predicted ferric reductase